MKNKLIKLIVVLFILSSCNPTEEKKENYYNIGTTEWYIDFPKNYVFFPNRPDTLESNFFCGRVRNSTSIKLLEIQENDTIWKDPVPNHLAVFLFPKNSINSTKEECIKQMIKSYTNLIEFAVGMEYQYKEKEVSIGGIDFMELENSILDSSGTLSHGDIQYFGMVSKNWMQIQLSYNNLTEREKMRKLILNSTFIDVARKKKT